MTPATPWRAFRHYNVRVFLLGHGLSLGGSWMQSLAQAWLVYTLTGSPLVLGVVEFLSRAPILVFGIVGGAIADRWPRRQLLLVTNTLLLLQATALAVLTLSGLISIEWIIGLAFVLGLVCAVEIPARHAFITDLVPRSEIPSAIGINSSLFNATRVIGPSLAGVIIAMYGEGWCFLLNAFSFLTILICLSVIRITQERKPEQPNTFHLLAEGLDYARRTPHVRFLLTLSMVLSLVALPYTTLLPVFAKDILKGGPETLGLLMGALGIGALTAALYLARRTHMKGLDLFIGRSVLCFGAGLLALAASPTMWLTVPALLVLGFGMVSSLAGTNTLLQGLAPNHLRGRVVSLYVTVSLGMTIFGSLLAGTGATYYGAPLTVTIGGLITLVSARMFLRTVPTIRRHIRRRELDMKQETPAA